MQIRADKRLGLNADNLPDGTLCPVAGTVFDLRTRRPLSQGFMSEAAQQQTKGFDHAFVPDPALCDGKQTVAAYWSPAGMCAWKWRPPCPAYSFIPAIISAVSRKTRRLSGLCGLALETQYFRTGRITRTGRMQSGNFSGGEQRESVTVYRFVF